MSCIVADAGPLIALARIDALAFLWELYGEVLVPLRVFTELRIGESRPGAMSLRTAQEAGWLRVVETNLSPETLRAIPVDPGEAEAIWLAENSPDLRFLLIDERRGRQLARQRGLAVVGTGGVLLVAKAEGLAPEIRSYLERLAEIGYHLAPRLSEEILRLAGELSDSVPQFPTTDRE